MKKTALRLGLFLGLMAFSTPQLLANVVITSPTGGNNIPADKALNSTNGAAFTALGNIVITEGVNTDFANGSGVTLILTIPDGWRFNPGVGTVTFTSGRNISAASISVVTNTATVTFTVSGAAALDTLTIGNLQVQALDVASYTNLSHNVTGDITIQFTATNLVSVTSSPITVGPGPANRLVFTTQPGSASAGYPFGIQPVVKSQDQFGNNSTAGLPASRSVTLTLTAGTGPLLGTATLDIGTSAGNGTATFTNLEIDAVGTGKQLTASASSMTNAVSASFGVSAGFFSKLQLLVPGETAAPGTASGKTGTPTAQAAGTPFNVTVNAVDANWNLINTISDTINLTSSDSNAALPANTALVSGTKTLSVTLNTVGSTTLSVIDV